MKNKLRITEINNIENMSFLKEYIKFCYLEWSLKEKSLEEYINYKIDVILNSDNAISILGLIDDEELIGFISILKFDSDEKKNLTPWYGTMYVKEEYRGMGYSKILNNAVLDKARELKYNKIYLKSSLVNYYEKFGAKFIQKLKNGENLYYIDLK